MEKFTRTEITWIIQELERSAGHAVNEADFKETSPLESRLLKLRAENLYSMAEKLHNTLNQGSKRIEVTH